MWYVRDPGGLFTIEGASRGTYVMLARAETTNGPLLGIAATDVSNDSVLDVRITLRTPGAIQGRVLVDGASGPELSRLRVVTEQTLLPSSPLYPAQEANLDDTGRFTVSNVAGEFAMTVQGLPPGWRVRRVSRAGTPLTDNRVAVPPGERVTGIEILVGNEAGRGKYRAVQLPP